MRIGIIGAMDEEIALYLELMGSKETTSKAGITYYSGKVEDNDIVLVKSGVGKVNASICTQILIDRFEVEAIIFTGVAGAVNPELNIGDIVVSTDCIQQDMDVTALGFAPGQIPYTDKWTWEADEKLVELALDASVKVTGEHRVISGRILTGDQFIADPARVAALYETFKGACIEMEGAAVAQVSSLNDVPFVIVRSMSDKADGSAHVNFAEFTDLASRRSYEIVIEMLKGLNR